jgi:exocyst complex protein 7
VETKILRGPHEDLESYLEAIAQLRSNIKFFSSKKGFKSSEGVLNNANSLLSKAISKLEDEFKQLLLSYRFVFSYSLMILNCVSSFAQVLLILLLL